MDHVAQGFEALGAAILVAGVVWSFVLAALLRVIPTSRRSIAASSVAGQVDHSDVRQSVER